MRTEAKLRGSDPFSPYVESLLGLLNSSEAESEEVDLALDGGAAAAHRASIALESRRATGAFFTPQKMANRLIGAKSIALRHSAIVDPACGAGDLLLAAARFLPRGDCALETLQTWGRVLIGRDLDLALIQACRLRLALLAAHLSESPLGATADEIKRALPRIVQGDGMELSLEKPALLLLNPPFGATVADTDWASGRIPRAALFAAKCFEQLPTESTVRAILPDVLRSGSHSAGWREHVDTLLDDVGIEIWGQFDPWTDVDVFLLRAERRPSSHLTTWWRALDSSAQIGDCFSVKVGTVVPHRDPKKGPKSPYICARDLPANGEFKAGDKMRRHSGTRFAAPFVAIRRTSRPSDGGPRLVATVVRSPEPVLVENHLIICRPKDGKLSSCRNLATTLTSPQTTKAVDGRIRCRHLTVGAVREIPYVGD